MAASVLSKARSRTLQNNNGEVGLVRQDSHGRITVGADKGGTSVDVGGTAGARTVTGVADGAIGKDSKDAVNGGQIYDLTTQMSNTNPTIESSAGELTRRLNAASVDSQAYTDQQMQSAVRSANAYTDQGIGSVRRDANAGIASAMAITAIPQATDHGKSAMGVAGATYDGESGVAVGISRVSSSGKWIFKGAANTNSRGAYGGAVGMARQW